MPVRAPESLNEPKTYMGSVTVGLPKSTVRDLKTLLARYDAADDYNRPAIGWTLRRFYEAVVRHQG